MRLTFFGLQRRVVRHEGTYVVGSHADETPLKDIATRPPPTWLANAAKAGTRR